MANTFIEAFKVYLREYLCKSEEEINVEVDRLAHCQELVESRTLL